MFLLQKPLHEQYGRKTKFAISRKREKRFCLETEIHVVSGCSCFSQFEIQPTNVKLKKSYSPRLKQTKMTYFEVSIFMSSTLKSCLPHV